MTHTKVTDEWLYGHMPYVDGAMIEELERQAKTNIRPSKKFERKMARILKKCTENDGIYNWRKDAGSGLGHGKRTWSWKVVAACTGIAASAVAVSAYASQTAFFKVLRTELEDMVLYTYQAKDTVGPIEMKEPGYVPEEYILQEKDINEVFTTYIYQNDDGCQMIFQQEIAKDGMQLGLDSEYDWKEQVRLPDGGTVNVYQYKDGASLCYLEYRDCIFMLDASGLDQGEITRIYTEWIK